MKGGGAGVEGDVMWVSILGVQWDVEVAFFWCSRGLGGGRG
jgi:hypothetical protein